MRINHAVGFLARLSTTPERQPISGIGNAVVHIGAAQAALGHRVTTFAFSGPFPPGTTTWQGMEIITMPGWRWARLGSLDASLLLPMLWQVVRRPPADVLHVHEELGLLYLPKARVRVLHLHAHPTLPAATYRRLLRRTDAVICCSNYVRETFLAVSGYLPPRTFVVYNGADPDLMDDSKIAETRQELGLAQEDAGVLFVGALVPEKGVHVLLDALYRLKVTQANVGVRIKTIIVGGSNLWRHKDDVSKFADAYEQELRAATYGLDVAFLGLMPYKEVQRFLQACEFLVCPSIVPEGQGLVICEAMAAGKAVVASHVGGIPETVLNGETGILVPPENADALAMAISHLAEDRDLRERMGCAARERARLFTWEVAAEKLEQIYRMLLQEKGRL